MSIEFGNALQYVITGSIDSGSAFETFPFDTVLTVPNYKNYIVKGIHATYNHAESYQEDTGLSVAISGSAGLFYLQKEQSLSPSSSMQVIAAPIVLTPGQSLLAKSRGLHTADLSVSYMVVSSSYYVL